MGKAHGTSRNAGYISIKDVPTSDEDRHCLSPAPIPPQPPRTRNHTGYELHAQEIFIDRRNKYMNEWSLKNNVCIWCYPFWWGHSYSRRTRSMSKGTHLKPLKSVWQMLHPLQMCPIMAPHSGPRRRLRSKACSALLVSSCSCGWSGSGAREIIPSLYV